MIENKFEITNLITPVINSYKLINNEWKHLFDIGLTEYLESQTEKYYFTNTFIHRTEKVRFTDIYYPIKAKYKLLTSDFKNISELFENYKNITIVGSAGSGKTTLMKYIFLNSFHTTKKIPILIELRNLNEYNGDIEKLIAEKVLKSSMMPSDSIFKRTLKSGSFIFLLDGYDEIFSNKKQEINRQIESFIDGYPLNNFIITTRPGGGIEGFSRFFDFKVCNLSNDEVEGFINKIVENEERKNRIFDLIRNPKNNNYVEFLRNPLLLSMFILAFENHPEIPAKKSAFYKNVFDTLYSKHDGITKNSFPREKLTKLQRDDFEKILGVFSYLTLIDGHFRFTEEYLSNMLMKVRESLDLKYKIEDLIFDLRTSISVLILDGFEYQFPHRSMQEYFAAHFISEIPSEKKVIAYKNLLSVLTQTSNDESFTLWSICCELDNSSFTSSFLVPQMKLIEKALTRKTDKEMLNAYLKIIRAVLVLNKNNTIGIYRQTNLPSSVIDFLEVYDFLKFAEFDGLENIKDEIFFLIPELKKSRLYHMEKSKYNKQIVDLLLKCCISKILIEYRDLVSKKILYLEQQLNRKRNSIDELLNII